MAEQSDTTATEPDETEETSVPDASSPPPWGEDFDAQRAWNTITHLRDREKELDPVAKTHERLRAGDDVESFRELAAIYGWEIPDADDDVDVQDQDDDDDPYAPKFGEYEERLSPVEKWVQEQQVEQALGAFQTHLDSLAKDKDLELDDDERKFLLAQSIQGGFTEKATADAFETYNQVLERRTSASRTSYKESKKAPHVASAGKPGTDVPELDTHEQRMQFYSDRMRSQE